MKNTNRHLLTLIFASSFRGSSLLAGGREPLRLRLVFRGNEPGG